MKKRMLALLLALMLLPVCALGEERAEETAPVQEQTTVYDPLPLGGAAPYGPVAGALSEDGMSYDDGTLKVRVETAVVSDVTVYYVYVTTQDKSQLRTATAGNPRSKTTVPVFAMAQENNAVLALNGDYYNYRDVGVVYRSGERIRNNIRQGMDMLIVDENGDLVIIESPTKTKVENYLKEHTIVEAFSFGPALVKDGVKLQFKYAEKNSCGYPTPDERLIICQLASEGAEKNFLFIACDDPGLSVRDMTDLALERGAVTAYNLDGGHSTSIYLCGKRINQIPKDRAVGDIIYFATLVPSAE